MDNSITREEFLALDDKIDMLHEKMHCVSTDIAIIKNHLLGNGHPGALEEIDDLDDRISKLENTGAYHKGIFSISILGTVILSGLTILNKLGII